MVLGKGRIRKKRKQRNISPCSQRSFMNGADSAGCLINIYSPPSLFLKAPDFKEASTFLHNTICFTKPVMFISHPLAGMALRTKLWLNSDFINFEEKYPKGLLENNSQKEKRPVGREKVSSSSSGCHCIWMWCLEWPLLSRYQHRGKLRQLKLKTEAKLEPCGPGVQTLPELFLLFKLAELGFPDIKHSTLNDLMPVSQWYTFLMAVILGPSERRWKKVKYFYSLDFLFIIAVHPTPQHFC